MSPGPSSPLTVLVVCTANICRSPAAEVLLRRVYGPASGVSVTSAGLHARTGEPMAPEMARLLGVPPETVVAEQFTPEAARRADLVLTMTREHRSAVVTAVPAALRRTFTLRELSSLAQLLRTGDGLPTDVPPGEWLAALVEVAPPHRSRRTAGPDDDVEDPYGRKPGVYARVLEVLEECVAALAP